MSSEDEGPTKTVADVFGSDSEEDDFIPKRNVREEVVLDSDDGDEAPRKRVLTRRKERDSDASDNLSESEVAEGNDENEASERESGDEGRKRRERRRMDDVFASGSEDDEAEGRSGRDESAGLDEGDDLFDNGDGDSDSRPKKSKKRKEGGEKGEKRKKRRRGNEEEEEEEDSQPVKPMSYIKQQIAEEKEKRKMKKHLVDEAAVEAWVQKVINDMKVAAELDREANMEKKPGTNKIRLLPLVVEELRIRDESKGKRADVDEIDRQELYIENGVLTMISAWLEPLPDKSLPAVQIRTAMLEALYDLYKPDAQLPVEQHREELKESQVGHRVRYLSKHPKEVLDNKKRCEDLMTKWARQVCNLPTDYSSISMEERKDIARRERMAMEERRRRALEAGVSPRTARSINNDGVGVSSSQDLEDALGGTQRVIKPGEPGWRRHAQIPQPTNRDYFVSPQVEVPEERGQQHKKQGQNRMEALKKRAKDAQLKTKSNRLSKMSIEGRGL